MGAETRPFSIARSARNPIFGFFAFGVGFPNGQIDTRSRVVLSQY
jgi:hypothetical protein